VLVEVQQQRRRIQFCRRPGDLTVRTRELFRPWMNKWNPGGRALRCGRFEVGHARSISPITR